MKERKFLLPVIFSAIMIAGILIGNWYGVRSNGRSGMSGVFKSGGQSSDGSLNFSLKPRTSKLTHVVNYIESRYVDSVDSKALNEAAIPAIIEKLDPHSLYIPARDLQRYTEPLAGNFSGIGIQFNMTEDTIAVVSTIPNGPSEIVGIIAGDRIIYVDDSLVAGQNIPSNDIVKMLKGPKGTTVRVSILRKGEAELLPFEITRDDIPLYSVDVAYMLNDSTGYMKISTFAMTTFKEFVEGIDKLHRLGMKKLVLDLRGNGGGLMEPAINMADQFLEENKMIVYTQGRTSPKREYYSTSRGICLNDEVVILLDEFSASASEILAGAIQDNDRGLIVGRRSFGKGLVQDQVEFNDGSAMRLTIARYYTPTGRNIQRPYSDNIEDYYNDFHERFLNRELETSDSIKFADSLKFVTPAGRIVYGGGGIMPDIFIPIDTSGISPYFNRVRNLGLIYRFAFDYTDSHRDQLEKLKTAWEIEAYLDKTSYFNDFLKYAEKKGVKKDPASIKISRELISTQLKAYIARNVIDNDGFYPIIKKIDKTLLEAESIIARKSS